MTDKDILLTKERALLCFFRKGCSMCLEAEPLSELLESRGLEVVRISCDESDDLLHEFGGDGTPHWCLVSKGEVEKSLCPTEDREALQAFVTEDCGISLTPDEFDKAMKAGEEKREYQEMVVAEILFRSKQSSEDSLTYAARLKIIRPCIMSENDDELRKCIRDNIDHFIERLQAAMEQEGGDTQARRNMLQKLPEMEEELISEIKEIKAH